MGPWCLFAAKLILELHLVAQTLESNFARILDFLTALTDNRSKPCKNPYNLL